ncbi:EAL and HDOD domain-containing protein [Galenea microaerophila]
MSPSQIFIARQPILDDKMQLFAYELRFFHGVFPNVELLEATEALIKETEEKIGFENIVGNAAVILSLPAPLIRPETVHLFPKNKKTFIELSKEVARAKEVLQNIKSLRQEGMELAIERFDGDETSLKLANACQYALIDVEEPSERKLKEMLAQLHEMGLKVIATPVSTEEAYHYYKKLGFDYFQGYFFSQPISLETGQELNGNKLTLIELLAKVNDEETDFNTLSEIIGHDPTLIEKLLEAINRPSAMIPVKVESVKDAITYMGLKRLKFWVNMLLLSNMQDIPQELIVSSLARAHFMEQLAEKSGHQKEKDSFFLTGLFSNLNAFFKLPLDEIVDKMPLAEPIKAALIEKKGPMGEALKVLQAIEQQQMARTDLHYENLGIAELANLYLSATAWAKAVTHPNAE